MENGSLKVLGIAGSLRKDSFNKKVLAELKSHAPTGVQVTTFSLDAVPLFNADDEEGGDPDEVAYFKKLIDEHDALYIVTPEYSHGMPGVLKNALDWAGSVTNTNVLAKKPAAVAGASPAPLGTALAQVQVKQTLAATGAYVVEQPEVFIGKVQNQINENGEFASEEMINLLRRSLQALHHRYLQMQKS
ncbi:NADPH-dependent FMN reductase [Salsuginibacillus kocurii]|uniref:NADPH-dependent FMN reductase n=1 Tax=Salsuginibacillus kocurii TaxID=427078 RepID=UPI000377B1AF|nr:NAD(P)H-dependent oxidoreductase [Salsuginibacillus kocurii]